MTAGNVLWLALKLPYRFVGMLRQVLFLPQVVFYCRVMPQIDNSKDHPLSHRRYGVLWILKVVCLRLTYVHLNLRMHVPLGRSSSGLIPWWAVSI